MNKLDFHALLHHPKIELENIEPLKDLTERFPFCQVVQVLLTYQLLRKNDLDYSAQLRKAAAYTSSRKQLKWLLESGPYESTFQKGEPNKEDQVIVVNENLTDEPVLLEVSESIVEPAKVHEPTEGKATDGDAERTQRRLTLLDIVNKRLAEIRAEKSATITTPEPLPAVTKTLSKAALIDKFIQEEPRISRPKADFFNPSDLAARSSVDEEEIVSETLAKLYWEQGNIEKAIHIYKKLCLLIPEKSSYFAAQIEKMG